MPLAKNGVKLESNDKEYCKFCCQASNVVIDSCLVSDHSLGTQFGFYGPYNRRGIIMCVPGGSTDQVFLNHRLHAGWVAAAALLQSCSSAIRDVSSVDAATMLVQ